MFKGLSDTLARTNTLIVFRSVVSTLSTCVVGLQLRGEGRHYQYWALIPPESAPQEDSSSRIDHMVLLKLCDGESFLLDKSPLDSIPLSAADSSLQLGLQDALDFLDTSLRLVNCAQAYNPLAYPSGKYVLPIPVDPPPPRIGQKMSPLGPGKSAPPLNAQRVGVVQSPNYHRSGYPSAVSASTTQRSSAQGISAPNSSEKRSLPQQQCLPLERQKKPRTNEVCPSRGLPYHSHFYCIARE